MKRDRVTSSTIGAVGYEKESSTLEVEFKTGAVYQYFDVPEPLYRRFMQASSKGKFFAAEIKAEFKYSRV